jgi:hypothetical protein
MTADRVRRLLLPLWVGYAVLWVLYWGYVAAFGGGIGTLSQAVSMGLSGFSGAIGLLTGWAVRRQR